MTMQFDLFFHLAHQRFDLFKLVPDITQIFLLL